MATTTEAVPATPERDPGVVREGDTVVLYSTPSIAKIDRVRRGGVHSNSYGTFRHESLLGKRFGSRVCGDGGRGWVRVLRATPTLWSRFLPHRTQVLYEADISQILSGLAVVPGSTVVECGTGSGSLTVSLARAVMPEGRVYTFDFNPTRYTEIQGALELMGVAGVVTASPGDATSDVGFAPRTGESLEGKVDAVFLDMPSPWLAVGNVVKVLRRGGILCSFSPCIEQVQRVCRELERQSRFHMLKTVECLERVYCMRRTKNFDSLSLEGEADSRKRGRETSSRAAEGTPRLSLVPALEQKGHTGFLTFATRSLMDSS